MSQSEVLIRQLLELDRSTVLAPLEPGNEVSAAFANESILTVQHASKPESVAADSIRTPSENVEAAMEHSFGAEPTNQWAQELLHRVENARRSVSELSRHSAMCASLDQQDAAASPNPPSCSSSRRVSALSSSDSPHAMADELPLDAVELPAQALPPMPPAPLIGGPPLVWCQGGADRREAATAFFTTPARAAGNRVAATPLASAPCLSVRSILTCEKYHQVR